MTDLGVCSPEQSICAKACSQQLSINSAFCRSRVAFCNRNGRNGRSIQFPLMQVNARLRPAPRLHTIIDTDTLTFYMFERICRSHRHED
jgi:hypothetical protein